MKLSVQLALLCATVFGSALAGDFAIEKRDPAPVRCAICPYPCITKTPVGEMSLDNRNAQQLDNPLALTLQTGSDKFTLEAVRVEDKQSNEAPISEWTITSTESTSNTAFIIGIGKTGLNEPGKDYVLHFFLNPKDTCKINIGMVGTEILMRTFPTAAVFK